MSQERLGELAGCHRNYIGLLESGRRNPSYLRLTHIASALRVSLSELLSGSSK
ncbi:MAG: helix-turn-helix transcriptional regulator [Blastocatellia bacterium]|nr:helix-turn-helix transcriptional regulator [Blastocatellia bacterium]